MITETLNYFVFSPAQKIFEGGLRLPLGCMAIYNGVEGYEFLREAYEVVPRAKSLEARVKNLGKSLGYGVLTSLSWLQATCSIQRVFFGFPETRETVETGRVGRFYSKVIPGMNAAELGLLAIGSADAALQTAKIAYRGYVTTPIGERIPVDRTQTAGKAALMSLTAATSFVASFWFASEAFGEGNSTVASLLSPLP